jgi:hypothetical protein
METFFGIFCIICIAALAVMTIAYVIAHLRVLWYKRRIRQELKRSEILTKEVEAIVVKPEPILFKTFDVEENKPFVSYADFITCETKSDYSCLVHTGKPSKEELYAAWMLILSQYYQLIGSKEAASYIKSVSKIEAINTKVFQVKKIVDTLRVYYSQGLTEELKAWGYKLPFTRESLTKDLARVEIAISNDKAKLEIQRYEYEKQQGKKNKSDPKQSKESYIKVLLAIEKHRQISYEPNKLPLYNFCILYKELDDYNRLLKFKNKGNGSR